MPVLEPIGIACTPFSDEEEIPRQGAAASIELFAQYEPGLEGIEHSTHLWVLGWFEGASRSLTSRGRNAAAGAQPRGVFAMRSPSRPNPIGLSAARLIRREGPVLHLDRLDFRNGTPVLDIKPYSPGWDLIPSARSAHRYDLARYTPAELAAALERDACNAVGPDALAHPPIREMLDWLLAIAVDQGLELRSPQVAFELDTADARIEVLLCATGASLSNGRIIIKPGCSLRAVIRD